MKTIDSFSQLRKKRETARLCGVSPRTLDDWVAQGIIPYLAVGPRLHLFDIQKVQAALTEKFGVEAGKTLVQSGRHRDKSSNRQDVR